MNREMRDWELLHGRHLVTVLFTLYDNPSRVDYLLSNCYYGWKDSKYIGELDVLQVRAKRGGYHLFYDKYPMYGVPLCPDLCSLKQINTKKC